MSIQKTDMIYLRVTPQERKRIEEKMAELGIHNMSAYIRKMALDYGTGRPVRQQSESVRQAGQRKRQYLRSGYHGNAGAVSGDPGYRTQHFPEAGCAEMIEKGIGIPGADT